MLYQLSYSGVRSRLPPAGAQPGPTSAKACNGSGGQGRLVPRWMTDRPQTGAPGSISVVRAAVVLVVFVVAVVAPRGRGHAAEREQRADAPPRPRPRRTTTTGRAGGSTPRRPRTPRRPTTTTTEGRPQGRTGPRDDHDHRGPQHRQRRRGQRHERRTAWPRTTRPSSAPAAGPWGRRSTPTRPRPPRPSTTRRASSRRRRPSPPPSACSRPRCCRSPRATPVSYPTGTDVVVVIGAGPGRDAGA